MSVRVDVRDRDPAGVFENRVKGARRESVDAAPPGTVGAAEGNQDPIRRIPDDEIDVPVVIEIDDGSNRTE